MLELEYGFDGTLLRESESVHGGPEHRDVEGRIGAIVFYIVRFLRFAAKRHFRLGRMGASRARVPTPRRRVDQVSLQWN